MDCNQVVSLIDAYIDGELDLSSMLTLESHFVSCPRCRAQRDAKLLLSARLRVGLERHAAPADLRERLDLTIAPQQAKVIARGWQRRHVLALAASVAVAVVASSGSTYWLTRNSEQPKVANEVVASHIRSLMASHLIDVASADQHTVKPWFDGKVDVAPAVVDLSAQGFPLVGGRLDYIDRRPVAALVYRRFSHLINMFACPVMANEERDSVPEALTIRGYNLVYWTAGDVTYWAVSDAGLDDLQTFRALIQRTTASAS